MLSVHFVIHNFYRDIRSNSNNVKKEREGGGMKNKVLPLLGKTLGCKSCPKKKIVSWPCHRHCVVEYRVMKHVEKEMAKQGNKQ